MNTSTERLVRGLDFLLSEKTGCRTSSVDSFGSPESHVRIKEEDTIMPNLPPVFGVTISADYGYDPAGPLESASADIFDRNANFGINLPLDARTGEIDAGQVATWDELTQQRAGVIVGRLMEVVFRA